MNSGWEIAANVFYAVSVLLAGLNSSHTWWTGIVGCTLFGYVFYGSKLYADVTLQVFFIGTSSFGWWNWLKGRGGAELPVQKSRSGTLILLATAGMAVAAGYGWLLHHFTDAYAPFLDSLVLAFSVLGQFLLMGRRIENWWCWILVNTIAVPLYATRGLTVTSVLYAVFWINALVSLYRWRKFVRKT
jgi:nicotinamide mononucleotide transporter